MYHRLEMESVQHSPSFVIRDQNTFRFWVRKESLIRTATIMMMLDNAFGIFNNVPPRIQWSEIDLPFPSDDVCFKAANYSELLSIQRFPAPRIKIKSAFVLLFGPTDSIDTERALQSAALTVLDLQMLIHSKQPSPFSPHFLLPLPFPIQYLIPSLFQ